MKPATLTELGKQNSYILNLIEVHRRDINVKIENILEPLSNELRVETFMLCVHLHCDPVQISIYNGTEDNSHRLQIENLEIIKISSSFPEEVKQIVERHLKELS